MPELNYLRVAHPLLAASLVAVFALDCSALLAGVDPLAPEQQSKGPQGAAQTLQLAENYLTGRNAPRDLSRAAQLMVRAAEAGDPDAQTRLGMMYQTGTGVPHDAALALHWYQLGAAGGSLGAKVNMGILFARGTGVRQDPAVAMQLFREAVDKGYAAGAAYLGEMYFLGCGIPADHAAAEKWFAKGMKMHDPTSTYDLGILYTGEYGHAQDLPRAADLFRKAAKVDYVPAQYSLGLLISRRPDLADSRNEARTWLESASKAGFWKADVVLGILSRDGDGVRKDQEAALYYFDRAIAQGGESARQLLAKDLQVLSKKIAPDRAAEIVSQAGEWAKSHPPAFLLVDTHGRQLSDALWFYHPGSGAASEKTVTSPPPA